MILSQSKSFIKDSKKIKMSDKHFTRFVKYLGLLIDKKSLPIEAQDHALKGEWCDFREFHVSGDLLVIYQVEGTIIKLVRIGSHSQLFN